MKPPYDNMFCRGRLTKESRAKIITLITIDVHGRDVVQGLIDRRVESNLDFAWQSQLRYHMLPAFVPTNLRLGLSSGTCCQPSSSYLATFTISPAFMVLI